jgi:pantoate--beta-alanine ligase
MKVCRTIEEMAFYSQDARASGRDLGFVPTMGALHAGHLSLVERSAAETDSTVVSIFVNPTQFGPGEDLEAYPRDLEGDSEKLKALGTDCLFFPTPEEMYRDGYATYVTQERLTGVLCGVSRPTHFTGVLTVVLKLFNIVRPHRAYFGQKDYQQSVVIRRMVKDLDVPVEIVVLPIVREDDGLAMSSRNAYLSPSERNDAVCLHRALLRGRELIGKGEASAAAVVKAMRGVVEGSPGVRIDYMSVVHPESLQGIEKIDGAVVLAGAVFVGGTRLIDNIIVERS